MKKYNGLFILNTAGKEEGIKEMIDKITTEINAAGGRVETVQKMDKRPFARVADKRHTSGFYVNFAIDIKPGAIAGLRSKFVLSEDIFRVLFTEAAAEKPVVAA